MRLLRWRNGGQLAFLAIMLAAAQPWPLRAGEEARAGKWAPSVSVGWLDFEGDETVADGFLMSLHLSYRWSERWTLDTVLDIVPQIDSNTRKDWQTGETLLRLEEETGQRETSSLGLNVDALYHLLRAGRLDPYVAAGCGVAWYADDFGDQLEPMVRTGGGVMYHLNDEWALSADVRLIVAGGDTEFNSTYTVGIRWSPGTARPAVEPIVDSDSDSDGLTDSEEVQRYHTDPLKRDTDGGGVSDGHEVLEDRSDPLDKVDDLTVFELHMNWDEDQWEIRAEYFSELDAIARILTDDAGAKARIEGHVDRKQDSDERRERTLTQKRAQSILRHFRDNGRIERGRMEAVGYGFSRPKSPNDPVNGNPDNSRMEIYIRSSKPGGHEALQ